MQVLLIRNTKIKRLLLILFLAVFLSTLICVGYKGFFSRYLQDDYCYGKTINDKGLIGGTLYSYFNHTEFNGNRYSLTFFAGLAEMILGTKLSSLYSFSAVLIWLILFSLLINAIFSKIDQRNPFVIALLVASILLTFSFYLSPDLYQTLYWRSSSLPYLAPLISNTFLFVYALYILKLRKRTWVAAVFLTFLSFLSAGFSEVGTTWQITFWGLLLILNLAFNHSRESKKNINKIIVFALIGAFIGATLLVLSPSNTEALQNGSGKIATFTVLLEKSLRYGLDFLKYTIAGKWLPNIMLFLIGFVFAQILEFPRISPIKSFFFILGIILCTYVLCVACMMPSVLVRTAYPDPRALFIPQFTLMISIFMTGILTGTSLRINRIYEKYTIIPNIGLVLIICCILAYSIRIIPILLADVPSLRARAMAWDQRQTLIFEEKSLGQTHIKVPAFDNIDKITELQTNESHWVNKCAAQYYGVESISAIENYNGVKPYFLNNDNRP